MIAVDVEIDDEDICEITDSLVQVLREEGDGLEQALRDIDPTELRAPVLRRIAPSGFVTEDVLARIHARLRRERVDGTSLLVDVGCGRAGASLWFAETTGARLHGIDIDPDAIAQARLAAQSYRLACESKFDCAAFEATWVEPGTAHVVISIDALHLAARPLDALWEIHRILIKGGVVLFNVYTSEDDPDATEWVHALEAVGFTTLDIDDQTDRWREVMTARHRARIEHATYLRRRFGTQVAGELASSRALLGLDYGPSVIACTRRVELFARKVHSHALRRRFAHGSMPTICQVASNDEHS
jgi:SAM-dependent methyltransferase